MAWTALSARLYRWQSRVSSLGWRFGGASDHVGTKEYKVLILSPEGHVLDQHTMARQSGWEARDNQDGESVSRRDDDCRDDRRAQEFF
jgi:hypothetical protein